MLNKILDKLGFQRTSDVWEENERLRAKLSLAEKVSVAHETNANLTYQKWDDLRKRQARLNTKYHQACLRVIELEGEVNVLCELTARKHRYPKKGK